MAIHLEKISLWNFYSYNYVLGQIQLNKIGWPLGSLVCFHSTDWFFAVKTYRDKHDLANSVIIIISIWLWLQWSWSAWQFPKWPSNNSNFFSAFYWGHLKGVGCQKEDVSSQQPQMGDPESWRGYYRAIMGSWPGVYIRKDGSQTRCGTCGGEQMIVNF